MTGVVLPGRSAGRLFRDTKGMDTGGRSVDQWGGFTGERGDGFIALRNLHPSRRNGFIVV